MTRQESQPYQNQEKANKFSQLDPRMSRLVNMALTSKHSVLRQEKGGEDLHIRPADAWGLHNNYLLDIVQLRNQGVNRSEIRLEISLGRDEIVHVASQAPVRIIVPYAEPQYYDDEGHSLLALASHLDHLGKSIRRGSNTVYNLLSPTENDIVPQGNYAYRLRSEHELRRVEKTLQTLRMRESYFELTPGEIRKRREFEEARTILEQRIRYW